MNMITNNDVAKIRKALKPDFDRLDQKIDRLDNKLGQTEKNIRQYIHEGVNAVVQGVDNLFQEYKLDERLKKLENIHPDNRHHLVDQN